MIVALLFFFWIENGFSRITKEFASKDSLGTSEYYNILANTKFLPIPHGYNVPKGKELTIAGHGHFEVQSFPQTVEPSGTSPMAQG